MSHEVVIEEQEMSPDMSRLFEQGRRNLLWFNKNAKQLGGYDLHRGSPS